MLLHLAPAAVPGSAAGQVQDDTSQLVYAAARYVLDHERSLPAPGKIVVDVETALGFSIAGSEMEPPTRSAAARLTSSLRARPGRLEQVIECRERFPTPEEMTAGYSGRCWLRSNTKIVIQVTNPTIEGDQAFVWVAFWRGVTDGEGRPKYVSAHSRQVKLIRGQDDAWIPTELTKESFGHY